MRILPPVVLDLAVPAPLALALALALAMPPGRSLLMWSVGERLLGALGLLAGLWLAVAWALNDLG